jgi:hypothetical protein
LRALGAALALLAACTSPGAAPVPPVRTIAIATAPPAAVTADAKAPVDPCAVLLSAEAARDEEGRAFARAALLAAERAGQTPDAERVASLEKNLALAEKAGDAPRADDIRKSLAETRARAPVHEPVNAPPSPGAAPAKCARDKAGAWKLTELAVEYVPPGNGDWREPWTRNTAIAVARADEQGTLSTAPITTFRAAGGEGDPKDRFVRHDLGKIELNCCGDFGAEPRQTFLGDVDGDGIPEIAFAAEMTYEGSHDLWSALFKATPEGLVVMANGFADVEDVTGDGFPDLVYREDFPAGSACGSGFDLHGEEPPFVAHNRHDGTFSKTDAEARAYARTWCPARPKTFAKVNDVVCGTLWGAHDAAKAYLRKHYAPLDCDAVMAGTPQRNPKASEEYATLMGALDVTVPFRLDDASSAPPPAPPPPK